MRKDDKDALLVWSSEKGRICPGCGESTAECRCTKIRRQPSGDGIVRIRLESKGRGGKTVTVVSGIQGEVLAIKALATELKKRCGSGGTVKDGNIEIQGDFCELLVAELIKKGLQVKRAGG